MAQQHDPERQPETISARRASARRIEKGWTVYDAVGHPIGTVTDVDSGRDVLTIDGRPVGLDAFEVPLDLVTRTGDNEIHLSKVIEEGSLSTSTPPRLVDPPAESSPTAATRTRGRTRSGAASTGDLTAVPGAAASTTTGSATTTPIRPASPAFGQATGPMTTGPTSAAQSTPSRPNTAAAEPTPASSFREFSPPYARSGAPDPIPDYASTEWGGGDDSGHWGAKTIGMTALALGGLAAAGYVMRRRARRRTPYQRFMASASDYVGTASDYLGTATGYASDVASEIAKQRSPAWLGALAAAAALPLAYYAWPSSPPSYGDRAREQAEGLSGAFGSYWHDLADRMPGMADSARDWSTQMRRRMPSTRDVELPSGWSMPTGWSAKPDVMLPIGLVAVSALALYLARRAMAKPRLNARIGDIMTRKPRVIQPDATVADAAAMMRRLDVGALPVCDGSRLIGMVTDRDITTRSTAEGRDPHLTPVRDVMSPGVAWANEDDPVEEAARIMREHQIRRLPIVDERHSLVGVVSLGDLATEVGDDVTSGDTLERISEE